MVGLTLDITRFETLPGNNPDTGGGGNFFAELAIRQAGMADRTRTTPTIDDGDGDFVITNFDWQLSAQINTANGPVQIVIHVIDFDTGAAGDNDEMDTSPVPGRRGELVLSLDPRTGVLTNEDGSPFPGFGDLQGRNPSFGFFSTGSGHPNLGQVFFRINMTPGSANADTDGDGLLDTWEIWGINNNNRTPTSIDFSSTPDLRLPDANVDHKDLYVEVDAMRDIAPTGSLYPDPNALNDVVAAFRAAPNSLVQNPDGRDGVELHIQRDETDIPFQATWNTFDVYGWPTDFDRIKSNTNPTVAGGFGTVMERSNIANFANIRAAKALAYRYCIFANRWGPMTPGTGSSGHAELPGNDFYVTLGGFTPFGGTRQDQAGTFMHELGHTLGLHHGGEVSARTGTLTPGTATITGLNTANLFPGLRVSGDGIPYGVPLFLNPQRPTITAGSATITNVTTRDAAGNQVLFPGMLVFGLGPTVGPLPGTLQAGQRVVTNIASTALLAPGRLVNGVGIPFGTTISSVDSPTQITLSTPALVSGTPSLSFPTHVINNVDTVTNTITLNSPVPAVVAPMNGTLTLNSAMVTVANTAGLFPGVLVTGAGIPANTTIRTIDSATQFTLSNPATGGGSQSLTFTPTTLFFTSTFITSVDTASGQVTLNQMSTISASATPTLFFTDETNWKPNYNSVMNYEWQLPGGGAAIDNPAPAYTASWNITGLDYSRQALPDLDESQLNEMVPLGGDPAVTLGVVLRPNPGGDFVFQQYVRENAAVNWDNDGTTGETSVPLEINNDGQMTLLHGFEDWSKLVYNFRLNSLDSAAGAHGSTAIEDYTSPESRLGIGDAQHPAGAPNFVTSATPLSVFASDDLSGVRSDSYRFFLQGSAAPEFTVVAGPYAQFTLNGPDGTYQVETLATDNAGNGEATHVRLITLDNTPPVITIVQPAATEYAHSDFLTLNYNVSDGAGSGVSSFTTTLNGATTLAGHGLQSGQVIYLLTELPVGTHTFAIAASDNLQNSSTATVMFEVIVTPESIKEDVRYFLSVGAIKNKGLANSLLAKLNAAARAIERDQCPTAINIYNAFIHELNAQSGKGVDPTAAAIMIADAEYLIANCDRFVPGAVQAAPAAAMGDFTKDGAVNGADYAVWRKTQGHHVPKHSGADGDGDGVLGQGDFNVWRAHFGMTIPSPGAGHAAFLPTFSAPVIQVREPAVFLPTEPISAPVETGLTPSRPSNLAALDRPSHWQDGASRKRGPIHRYLLAETGADDLLLLAVDRVGRFPVRDFLAQDRGTNDEKRDDNDNSQNQFDEPLAAALADWR
jgi:hypothetical protein